MKQPTYHTLLPPQVRFDSRLCPFARLLYSEIATLSGQTGYCWASNAFFAQLYQVQEKAVTRWLKELRTAGHIRVEVQQGNQRKIFLTASLALNATPESAPSKTEGTPPITEEVVRYRETGASPLGGAVAASLLIDKNNNINEYIRSAPLLSKGEDDEENKQLSSAVEQTHLAKDGRVSAPHPPVARRPPPPTAKKQQAQSFAKPTLSEVEAYMQEQKQLCPDRYQAKDQALRFVNYYASNGWKVGRNQMQDWQAAANNWLLNMKTYSQPKSNRNETHNRLHSGGKKDYSIPL